MIRRVEAIVARPGRDVHVHVLGMLMGPVVGTRHVVIHNNTSRTGGMRWEIYRAGGVKQDLFQLVRPALIFRQARAEGVEHVDSRTLVNRWTARVTRFNYEILFIYLWFSRFSTQKKFDLFLFLCPRGTCALSWIVEVNISSIWESLIFLIIEWVEVLSLRRVQLTLVVLSFLSWLYLIQVAIVFPVVGEPWSLLIRSF